MVVLTECCLCIPLKSGVVIISSLWLIYGIFQTLSSALYLTSPNEGTNVFKYISACTVSMIIFYGLIIIGATFGLIVVIFADTTKLLIIYSRIAYGIVGIDIISHIVTIIVIIAYRSTILDKCTKSINSINVDINNIVDACNSGYTSVLMFVIAIAVISTLLSVYFAIMIATYAKKRKGDGGQNNANNENEMMDQNDLDRGVYNIS